MKLIILIGIILFMTSCTGKPDRRKVEIENSVVVEIDSKYTNEQYDIYISYPADLKTSGKKYPLLVVLDAEVNFGAVNYISNRLIKDNLVPELIIAGIAYRGDTDEDTYYSIRSKDFTPSTDKAQEQRHQDKFMSGSGGAEKFTSFLSSELFPYLFSNYPIDPNDKTIYGHSFGGLFGFHVLLDHPTLFNNYLLLSPSLWWNRGEILKNPKLNSTSQSKQLKLYIGTGSLEDTMVDDHQTMVKLLKQGADPVKIRSEILDNETHRTVFGRGFTNDLRFLFGPG